MFIDIGGIVAYYCTFLFYYMYVPSIFNSITYSVLSMDTLS